MAKKKAPEPSYPVDVSFTVLGPPATKGNSGRHGFHPTTGRPMRWPSKTYARWKRLADQQLPIVRRACAMAWEIDGTAALPILGPLDITAVFYRTRNVGDQDNYFKGLGDWLQRARIIGNDKQLHYTGESRLDKDTVRPRVEVRLQRAAAPGERVTDWTEPRRPGARPRLDPEDLGTLRGLLERALPFVDADAPGGLARQIREVLGLPSRVRELGPTYNHTRGDSMLTPCPLCR